ncbi:MAG: hypothetical protein GY874_04290 [Desulfobacteraceae bacterium]|nr:hypothetical protein [Desulfobacteraceae bacterium]
MNKAFFWMSLILVLMLFSLNSLPAGINSKNLNLKNPGEIKEQKNLSLLNNARHSLTGACNYLISSQKPDGSWKDDPGISALVLYSFLLDPRYDAHGRSVKTIEKGLAYLEEFIKPDGGIYREGYRNYTTAVCLLAFTQTEDVKYASIITGAKNFLIKFQLDEEELIDKKHPHYGGIGYGGDDRPDLSNTQFALEAIYKAEKFEQRYQSVLPKNKKTLEDEKKQGLHWEKALVFLARCQNVKQVNDMDYATDDGGFIYESGHYDDKTRNHSYGSMTYAGVKSLLYAKVDKKDIRVKRAVEWINKNYTVDENPGLGDQSLYYYYMTAAKCLNALGDDAVKDAKGMTHKWREEFIRKLISLQKEHGHWVNSNGRWWENIRDLSTAYAMISMKHAIKTLY